MPLLQTTNLSPTTPTIQEVTKTAVSPCTSLQEAVVCLVKHGVAFLDTKQEIIPPWDNIEKIFNNLDQDTINLVNSCYDEKKIIKSGFEDGQGLDIDQ